MYAPKGKAHWFRPSEGCGDLCKESALDQMASHDYLMNPTNHFAPCRAIKILFASHLLQNFHKLVQIKQALLLLGC